MTIAFAMVSTILFAFYSLIVQEQFSDDCSLRLGLYHSLFLELIAREPFSDEKGSNILSASSSLTGSKQESSPYLLIKR
jgi:hypothetical protein